MTTLAAETENGVLVAPPAVVRMTSHIGGDKNSMPWVTEKDETEPVKAATTEEAKSEVPPMSLPPILEAAEEGKPTEEAKPEEKTPDEAPAEAPAEEKTEEKKPDEAPAEEKTEEKTPDGASLKTDASGNVVDPSDDAPTIATEIVNKVVDEAVASGEKIVAEVAEAAQKVVDDEKPGLKRVNSEVAHEAAKCAKIEEPATPRPVSSTA